MFEGWSYCWFKDRSRGNRFKCLSKGNGEHTGTGKGRGRKEERDSIIKPFGSGINT